MRSPLSLSFTDEHGPLSRLSHGAAVAYLRPAVQQITIYFRSPEDGHEDEVPTIYQRERPGLWRLVQIARPASDGRLPWPRDTLFDPDDRQRGAEHAALNAQLELLWAHLPQLLAAVDERPA